VEEAVLALVCCHLSRGEFVRVSGLTWLVAMERSCGDTAKETVVEILLVRRLVFCALEKESGCRWLAPAYGV
jgi:hypothetical protein